MKELNRTIQSRPYALPLYTLYLNLNRLSISEPALKSSTLIEGTESDEKVMAIHTKGPLPLYILYLAVNRLSISEPVMKYSTLIAIIILPPFIDASKLIQWDGGTELNAKVMLLGW